MWVTAFPYKTLTKHQSAIIPYQRHTVYTLKKKEIKYSLNTSYTHLLHAELVILEATGYQSDTPKRKTEM